MPHLHILVWVLGSALLARATPNGAPCSAIASFAPDPVRHGAPPQTSSLDSMYTLKIFKRGDVNERRIRIYTPGDTYVVRLSGEPFRGILAQFRVVTRNGEIDSVRRVGEFLDTDLIEQGLQYLVCSAVNYRDAITHTDANQKSQIEILWRPISNEGPVQFVATIAQERDRYWVGHEFKHGFLRSIDEDSAVKSSNTGIRRKPVNNPVEFNQDKPSEAVPSTPLEVQTISLAELETTTAPSTTTENQTSATPTEEIATMILSENATEFFNVTDISLENTTFFEEPQNATELTANATESTANSIESTTNATESTANVTESTTNATELIAIFHLTTLPVETTLIEEETTVTEKITTEQAEETTTTSATPRTTEWITPVPPILIEITEDGNRIFIDPIEASPIESELDILKKPEQTAPHIQFPGSAKIVTEFSIDGPTVHGRKVESDVAVNIASEVNATVADLLALDLGHFERSDTAVVKNELNEAQMIAMFNPEPRTTSTTTTTPKPTTTTVRVRSPITRLPRITNSGSRITTRSPPKPRETPRTVRIQKTEVLSCSELEDAWAECADWQEHCSKKWVRLYCRKACCHFRV